MKSARIVRGSPLPAIIERSLITMVSIGDQDPFRLERALYNRDLVWCLDCAQFVANSERIEFVESEKTLGKGEGGKNEDEEYFDLLPNI